MGIPDYDKVNSAIGSTPITHGITDAAHKETNDSQFNSLMANTGQAQGLMAGDNFDQSIGMSTPMSAAISQRANKAAGLERAKLNHEMGEKAKDMHFQKVVQAEKLSGQEQNMNYQKALLKWKQKQASKAARAGLIGAVLGTGGAIAGAYYGGAGGAMAGQAAGSLVGNMSGGMDE